MCGPLGIMSSLKRPFCGWARHRFAGLHLGFKKTFTLDKMDQIAGLTFRKEL